LDPGDSDRGPLGHPKGTDEGLDRGYPGVRRRDLVVEKTLERRQVAALQAHKVLRQRKSGTGSCFVAQNSGEHQGIVWGVSEALCAGSWGGLAAQDDPDRGVRPTLAKQRVAETIAGATATLAQGIAGRPTGALGAADTLAGAQHTEALAVAVDRGVDDRGPGQGIGLLGPVGHHELDAVEGQGVCLVLCDKEIGKDEVDAGLDEGSLLDDDGGRFIADQDSGGAPAKPICGGVSPVASPDGFLEAQSDPKNGIGVNDDRAGIVNVQVKEEDIGLLFAQEKRDIAADITGHHHVEVRAAGRRHGKHAPAEAEVGSQRGIFCVELVAVEPVLAISAVFIAPILLHF